MRFFFVSLETLIPWSTSTRVSSICPSLSSSVRSEISTGGFACTRGKNWQVISLVTGKISQSQWQLECVPLGNGEAGLAQWWERSPSTNVSRFRLPNPVSYVDRVCWFSTLLREVFLRLLRFSPLLKNQHSIWFDLIWFVWFIDLIWFI